MRWAAEIAIAPVASSRAPPGWLRRFSLHAIQTAFSLRPFFCPVPKPPRNSALSSSSSWPNGPPPSWASTICDVSETYRVCRPPARCICVAETLLSSHLGLTSLPLSCPRRFTMCDRAKPEVRQAWADARAFAAWQRAARAASLSSL